MLPPFKNITHPQNEQIAPENGPPKTKPGDSKTWVLHPGWLRFRDPYFMAYEIIPI